MRVPSGGGAFVVPFANVVPLSQGRMAGETIYFDLATLCKQARLPLEEVRAAAAARRRAAPVHRRKPDAWRSPNVRSGEIPDTVYRGLL
jgi:hypothetical protein